MTIHIYVYCIPPFWPTLLAAFSMILAAPYDHDVPALNQNYPHSYQFRGSTERKLQRVGNWEVAARIPVTAK